MWWWNDASHGWPWWVLMHGIGPIFLVALLVVVAIMVVRFVGDRDGTVQRTGSTALEILERRYASGEIDREEYLQKRRDILDRAAV